MQLRDRPPLFFFSGGTSHSLGTSVLENDPDFGNVPINVARDDFELREFAAKLYVQHSVCFALT
jgi:hypothetical protein